MAEDEMAGWHHRLDYHEVWTPTQSIPISSLRATMNKIEIPSPTELTGMY